MIGVDLGGTKLLAAVVDAELRVRHRTRRLVGSTGRAALLNLIEEAVREALEAADGEVSGVGFGIPSLLDLDRGVSDLSVHLPLDGVAFRDVMGERLGLPVAVDNDTNLALLAEYRWGAAAGARVALMLTLGTGIGGAVMIDGELFRGAGGAGGELGHVVVDLDGPPCQGGCPNRGCLEAMASGPALEREARRLAAACPESALATSFRAGGELDGPVVADLARRGDAAAIEAVALVGRRLGAGLSGLVNAFNPDVVVVGGGVSATGDLLLAPARAEVLARTLAPARDRVRIVPARFGEEAGLLGAAALALDLAADRTLA